MYASFGALICSRFRAAGRDRLAACSDLGRRSDSSRILRSSHHHRYLASFPTKTPPRLNCKLGCSRLSLAGLPNPAPLRTLAMVASRLLRPAARQLLSRPCPSPNAVLRPAAPVAWNAQRRRYATPSGAKEYTVRDALNEALAEELESNPKVFVLGEEVAQYNGA